MDDVTKKTIEELVLNFISEMNEWEKFCNNLKKENTQLSWNEKGYDETKGSFYIHQILYK